MEKYCFIWSLAVFPLALSLSSCGSKDEGSSLPLSSGAPSAQTAASSSSLAGPAITDVVTTDARSRRFCAAQDQNVCLMTRAQAVRYCRSINAHLPTAREWVQYAVTRGATGTREPHDPEISSVTSPSTAREVTDMENEEFYIVRRKRLNSVGLPVPEFYYNATGYQPAEDMRRYFWVSTISGVNTFNGTRGYLSNLISEVDDDLHHLRAVRCINGR